MSYRNKQPRRGYLNDVENAVFCQPTCMRSYSLSELMKFENSLYLAGQVDYFHKIGDPFNRLL